eukprot:TRINITY_DN71111_c0_g1_i1.p2 TRINITY_DN71111_c0_g1~~TRINITY_DN71111_c0_g1_i1.p2  ORF type:complete len:119 (-),score=31.17 TRINITY_DN71111_c0_g1_i1:19-375(-)
MSDDTESRLFALTAQLLSALQAAQFEEAHAISKEMLALDPSCVVAKDLQGIIEQRAAQLAERSESGEPEDEATSDAASDPDDDDEDDDAGQPEAAPGDSGLWTVDAILARLDGFEAKK